jgi:hypothetical protein
MPGNHGVVATLDHPSFPSARATEAVLRILPIVRRGVGFSIPTTTRISGTLKWRMNSVSFGISNDELRPRRRLAIGLYRSGSTLMCQSTGSPRTSTTEAS